MGWIALGLILGEALADDVPSASETAEVLRKACEFFRNEVSTEGGYLWVYSHDLRKREGEGKAGPSTVWVQPPGTPSVGMAFLDVYEATQDEFYLRLALDAGHCLLQGQLVSGGWDYRIDFDQERRRTRAYRVDNPQSGKNVTVLDDNTTQAALRFLIRLDEALAFKNEAIHEAVEYALERLIAAQYPNGAWPQRFDAPPDPAQFPLKPANYPKSWSRTFPAEKYSHRYTFNDNAIADALEVVFLAGRVYGDARHRQAGRKAGDFILLAQMPAPQPGWAQQYTADMQPAWARKFEPPAITGGEARGVMKALMTVYRETGDAKYIETIPRALDYYRTCVLPNGQLARFYELQTNRPLYFTKQYKLTYDDGDMPTHYSFKLTNWIESVSRQCEKIKAMTPEELAASRRPSRRTPSSPESLRRKVQEAIRALDDRGAWVEAGELKYHKDDDTRRVISSRTFAANIRALSAYVAASK